MQQNARKGDIICEVNILKKAILAVFAPKVRANIHLVNEKGGKIWDWWNVETNAVFAR